MIKVNAFYDVENMCQPKWRIRLWMHELNWIQKTGNLKGLPVFLCTHGMQNIAF